MSGTLPNVRGAFQALYPVTRSVEFLTRVNIFLNATEQRWKLRPPLTRFVFPYTRINATELGNFQAFYEAQKGPFDSTWAVTLGTTMYHHLALDDAQFTASESTQWPGSVSYSIKAHQTQNSGQTAGSPGGTLPTLANGATTQFPYVQMRRAQVMLNDSPIGIRYAWTWFAGGLSGFPTRCLRGWELTYSSITDADLATLETFFRNQWGRWSAFTFVDPDTTTAYTKCRFDHDEFTVTMKAVDQNAVKLRIMETN